MIAQSNKRHSNPFGIRPLFSLVLLGGLIFFVSCSEKTQKEMTEIAPPPSIPVPPNMLTSRKAFSSFSPSEESLKATAVTFNSPALKKALAFAREQGLLSIEGLKIEELKLDEPITRGEFAVWLAGFRKLPLQEPGFPRYTDVPKTHPYYIAIETVSAARLLKGNTLKGEAWFHPSEKIARDAFCDLYITLNKIETRRYKLDDFNQMHPATAKGPLYNFERFVDFDVIAPASRNHVALAYRDNLLEDAFQLSPEQLVSGGGFQPRRWVTRQEALLFFASQLKQ